MNTIPLSFYQELVQRLDQMTIRSNRHKVSLYTPLNPDQQTESPRLTEENSEHTVFAFNIMFERNNNESEWRLVTPLKFTE